MTRLLFLGLIIFAGLLLPRILRRSRAAAQRSPDLVAPAPNEDWQDLPFRIVSSQQATSQGRQLELAATYGPQLGLVVHLGPTWVEGNLGSTDIRTFQGTLTISPSGSGSDGFAADLDRRYQTGLRPKHTRPVVVFTAISLEGDPGHLEAGATKIKLFYEPDDEDKYAEAYLNIDLHGGTAELAEKDFDYRPNLVSAFSAP